MTAPITDADREAARETCRCRKCLYLHLWGPVDCKRDAIAQALATARQDGARGAVEALRSTGQLVSPKDRFGIHLQGHSEGLSDGARGERERVRGIVDVYLENAITDAAVPDMPMANQRERDDYVEDIRALLAELDGGE